MKNRRLFSIMILAAVVLPAVAQNDLNREVTVTRAYEPSVSESFKQGLIPDMADTTKIRPEFNYEINPYPLDYGFAVTPIKPVNLNTVDSKVYLPFYVKAGLGGPFQSLLDFSYGYRLNETATVGAILKHHGQYSKIKNDTGEKAPANVAYNSLNLFGDKTFGGDFIVAGNIDYSFDNVTRYGYYYYDEPMPVSFDDSRKGLAQFFHDIAVEASLGNTFTDMSKFNFKIEGGAGFFGDKFKYDQLSYNAGVKLSVGAGYYSQVYANADYNGVEGRRNLSRYSDDIFRAGLGYSFDNGNFRFTVGGEYAYYHTKGHGRENKFLPKVKVEFDLFDGYLTPYALADGEVERNDYRSLSKNNPYILDGLFLPTTVEYTGRMGVKGLLFGMLTYDLSGGYTFNDDFHFFVNYYDLKHYGNVFTALTDKTKIWDGKIALNADILRSFSLYASARFFSYNLDNYDEVGGFPDLETDFGIKYRFRNKFFAHLGMTLWSERVFYQYIFTNQLEMVNADNLMDLYINLDYFINKQFGIFVSGKNLLNKKLYVYNHYPLLGLNIIGGIKYSF